MYSRCVVILSLCAATSSSFAQTPLDVFDPTPRTILVRMEQTPDPAILGITYSDAVEAAYSVSGNIGTIEIAPEAYFQMRLDEYMQYAPGAWGTGSSLIIEIDLMTLEATSQAANFSYFWFVGAGIMNEAYFAQDVLATDVSAPVYPGHLYDPGTGRINLVGIETSQFCSRSACSPVLELPSRGGDLLLAETIVSLHGLRNQLFPVIPVILLVALIASAVLLRMLVEMRPSEPS